MKLRNLPALLFAVLVGAYSDAYPKDSVVLVTSQGCPVSALSSLDLRKIFFGFKVQRDGSLIRAYRNISDTRLEQIFLQAVVAMSKKSYRRRLLWLRLNYGNPKISVFEDPQKFFNQLSTWPCSVTYMWGKDVSPTGGLKILNILWERD